MPKKFFVQKATSEFWSNAWRANWQSIYGSIANLQRAEQSIHEHPTYKHLMRLLPLREMILEAGCGLGLWMRVLKQQGFRVVGLDFTTNILGNLQAVSSFLLCAGDVRQLPFIENSFDAYLSFGVIEHLEEGPTLALREAFRTLKPGGLFFCSVPYANPIRILSVPKDKLREFCFAQSNGYEFYQYAYRISEMKHFLKSEGLKVLEVHPQAIHMFLIGSRMFQRVFNIFYRILKRKEMVWGTTRPMSYSRDMRSQQLRPSRLGAYIEKIFKKVSNWGPLCRLLGHQILIVAIKPNSILSSGKRSTGAISY